MSVLIIEVHLFTGQALSPDNMAILQKVNELQAHTGLETIVMGDFQNDEQGLANSDWLGASPFVLLEHGKLTCFQRHPSSIDGCLVTPVLHSVMQAPEVKPGCRATHWALHATFPYIPRNIYGLQPRSVFGFPYFAHLVVDGELMFDTGACAHAIMMAGNV